MTADAFILQDGESRCGGTFMSNRWKRGGAPLYGLQRSLFRLLSLTLCLFIAASLCAPIAFAQKLDDRRVVRVGYIQNYGIVSQNRDRSYTGYVYDYLKEIAQHANWDYQFVPGSWEECLVRLESGEIDLLGPLQRTPEREQVYEYPDFSLGAETGVLYASASRDDLFYEDFQSLNGLRVGRVVGNYFNAAFDDYCRRQGVTVQYQDYDTIEEMRQGLQSGEVDAMACGSITSVSDVKILAQFSLAPFYFATTKGNAHILQWLNDAIVRIKTEDSSFDSKLYDKYYKNKSVSFLAFTREEQTYLNSQPTLRMSYNANWSPMEYKDPETGAFRGITADLMRKISAYSGIRFETVPADNYSIGLEQLDSGQADLIAGYVHLSQSAQNRGYMKTTEPYVEIPVVMIGNREMESGNRPRFALPASFNSIIQYVAQHYGEDSIEYFRSLEECLNAVRTGAADLTMMNSYQFDQQIRLAENENLYVVAMSEVTYPMCIGVSDRLPPVVLSILNKAIGRLSAEEVSTCVLNNTTEAYFQLPLNRVLHLYLPYLLGGGVVLLLMVAIVVLFNVRRTDRKLKNLLYKDKLTGAPTMEKFKLDAARLLEKLGGAHFTVIALDIDRFKDINDMFGYKAGDSALTYLTRRFIEDLRENELFARDSADHFVLLLAEHEQEAVSLRVHRVYQKLLTDYQKQQEIYNLVVNAGAYLGTPADTDINFMVDRANIARKTVKGGHESALAFYTEEIHKRVEKEKEVEGAMSAALRNREFVVYYQPKYSIQDRKLVGAEALVRWRHPEKGLIPPMDFIPLFERNGFIVNLDFFVFEEVCAKMREWLSSGKTPPPVSVNLSRLHLRSTNFISRFQAIRDRYDIPDEMIELELTETAVLDARSDLSIIMKRLKESGFLLSMDDFGSGYSSLNLLRELPVDVLKLDRAFFAEEKSNRRERVIIRNIVQMAKELRIHVLSEGVETDDQLEFLQEVGCDMVQGFLFARPMPVEEYEKLIFNETQG